MKYKLNKLQNVDYLLNFDLILNKQIQKKEEATNQTGINMNLQNSIIRTRNK